MRTLEGGPFKMLLITLAICTYLVLLTSASSTTDFKTYFDKVYGSYYRELGDLLLSFMRGRQ